RLKRIVALKFLPAELTKDKEAKKRFIQEAQAAASLEHPNICTVYEVDEADGQAFIAMSYIEGQSLKEKLKSGPLAIDEAKDIALQVAEGLKEAHEKGIVHRDIKPANIMLTNKGQAKITDFGLAKLSWGVDLTKTSAIMGTVAYMSPEQARGEDIDHRTDIWSLGAMMYEMFTGERPFTKDHEQALIFSILNDEPRSVSSLRSEVPSSLESTIQKALEKDATKRFQSVDEFIEAVKHPIDISTHKDDKSIAVLSFTNMSADPEQEYFCDGMAEEIINSLTKIKDLRVVARTSAFSFKGKDVDIREIGRKLNVEKVLEGSIRKSGNRLRITAQLINIEDGYHLWSERYDRNLEDVFDIQDEISLAIVDVLKATLLNREKEAIIKHPTDNLEAYNLYLLGRHYLWKITEENVMKSKDYFEHAIKLDSNYALAYAGLADTYLVLGGAGLTVLPPKIAVPKAKQAAIKAIELDPNIGEAHGSLGELYAWYEWNWDKGLRETKYGIEVEPNSALAHADYAHVLMIVGQHKEAISEQKQAISLDPLNALHVLLMSMRHYFARQYEEALEYCRRALELDPDHPYIYYCMGLVNVQKGNYEELELLLKEISSVHSWFSSLLGHAYGKLGKKSEATRIIKELESRKEKGFASASDMAVVYLGMGDVDNTFQNLEKSLDEGLEALTRVPWLGVDPIWDPIRSDKRFIKILSKIGLSHLAPKEENEASSISPEIHSAKFKKSIVVLPFDDVSPGKDNEYFSDGMTEEIISDLSKIHSMRVISRTSSMMLKGTRKSMKTIGLELDVQYVLEGSVRKAGNNLRITAQLIDATSDAHLWAEKYGGTLDDVFGIQENVSHSIVDALKLKLSPLEEQRVSERPIDDIQAYQFYLRAAREVWNWTEDALDRAVEYYQKSLSIMGDNALLYAGLGYVYWQYANIGINQEDYIEKAEDCVEKVFALDPDSSKGHFLLGMINMTFLGNQQLSVKHLKKALEIDPNDPDALGWLAFEYASAVGKSYAASPLYESFKLVDPLNRLYHGIKALPSFYEGQYELAIEEMRKWYLKEPDNPMVQIWYAYFLIYNKAFDEAFAVVDQSYKTTPQNSWSLQGIMWKYAYEGNGEKISQLMTPELRKYNRRDPFYSYWNVIVYIFLNDYEEAFDWLENSINQGWINYPFMSKHDHFLDKIHGEPRFKKLMERVKHEWENFEV
ncbi:protein kinase, partial [Acidobacteriota bacterium]